MFINRWPLHLTFSGGKSASISQSILHLIQCSVALVKMQGNTLLGLLVLFFA